MKNRKIAILCVALLLLTGCSSIEEESLAAFTGKEEIIVSSDACEVVEKTIIKEKDNIDEEQNQISSNIDVIEENKSQEESVEVIEPDESILSIANAINFSSNETVQEQDVEIVSFPITFNLLSLSYQSTRMFDETMSKDAAFNSKVDNGNGEITYTFNEGTEYLTFKDGFLYKAHLEGGLSSKIALFGVQPKSDVFSINDKLGTKFSTNSPPKAQLIIKDKQFGAVFTITLDVAGASVDSLDFSINNEQFPAFKTKAGNNEKTHSFDTSVVTVSENTDDAS